MKEGLLPTAGISGPMTGVPDLLKQVYDLNMQYDNSHNITQKKQDHQQGRVTTLGGPMNNIETMEETTYSLDYEDYASGSFTAGGHSYVQPHAPRTIVEYPYGAGADEPSAKRKLLDYDANGNLLLVEQEISDPGDPLGKAKISLRENLWDEEDRLRAVDLKPEAPSNKPEVAAYTYDASGERTIKYLPGRVDAYYSAKAAGSADRLESILYPSPLLTVKTRPLPEDMNMDLLQETSITTYTKHYYIGTERIASTLGTMKNLGLLCENIWPGSQDIIDEMGTKTVAAGDVLIADYDVFEKELQLPEPYLYETYICTKLEHDAKNYDTYWYHPDHLGSSSYITNLDGNINQHMEYLPFGETLVEEHLNSYNSPYKFNAKEYDAETGWYYYGARYYSPRENLMLSVDPASEMYPGVSPYAYTLQNPVRYVDPTGMVVESPPSTDVTKNEDGTYTVVGAYDDGDNNIYVVDADGNRTGEVMGQSIFADEFIDPESGDAMEGYTLYPNTPYTTDNNWEHILRPLANQADKLNLKEVALESTPGGLFDIKKDYAGQGRQFKGLGYATSRTAGNFLAGYNARRSSYLGVGIDFTSFQKLAGAVHQGVFNSSVAKDILLNGTSYGPAPYYGEIRYQYRASLLGWRVGGSNYLNSAGAGGRLGRGHLIGID